LEYLLLSVGYKEIGIGIDYRYDKFMNLRNYCHQRKDLNKEYQYKES